MTVRSDELIKEWGGEVLYLPEPTGKSAMIATVRDYWDRLRGARPFPTRAEIDPVALKDELAYLSIAEIQAEPFRIRYRLVGTEVARLYGGEMRGRWVDEMGGDWPPQDLIDTTETYSRIFRRRAPQFGLSLILWDDHVDNVFEFARFPLSDDGVAVTDCLGIDDFTQVTAPRRRAL